MLTITIFRLLSTFLIVSSNPDFCIVKSINFKVSNLIHTPSPIKPNIRSPHSSPGISPFARTNASIFQASMINNSFSSESLSKVKNNSRVRFLARGQIFEASQRMESTDAAYTNGQGLIKLTDGSGWVIIPHQEEIIKQYENFRGAVDVNNIIAFEEIGSAEITSTQSNPAYHATPSERSRRNESERSPNDVVWLRIAAPNGVKVILPPPLPDQAVRRDERDRAINPSTSGTDSEVASTVSSSFFDSMWSKVTPTKQKEGRGAAHDGSTAKLHHPSPRHGKNVAHNAPPVISCGMVVPVEHWENYQDDVDGNSKASRILKCDIFSRMFHFHTVVSTIWVNHVPIIYTEELCSFVWWSRLDPTNIRRDDI